MSLVKSHPISYWYCGKYLFKQNESMLSSPYAIELRTVIPCGCVKLNDQNKSIYFERFINCILIKINSFIQSQPFHIFKAFLFIFLLLPFQNFVVRGSSQVNTMAVSVRLPPDTGPYIEHYLILSENGVLSLESSRFEFNSIPNLIDHYAKCW